MSQSYSWYQQYRENNNLIEYLSSNLNLNEIGTLIKLISLLGFRLH